MGSRPPARGRHGPATVFDSGAGLGDEGLTRRGSSGSGSTGLGLDIVRRIARAAGGELSIGTRPGGGAEFRVSMPAHASTPTREARTAGPGCGSVRPLERGCGKDDAQPRKQGDEVTWAPYRGMQPGAATHRGEPSSVHRDGERRRRGEGTGEQGDRRRCELAEAGDGAAPVGHPPDPTDCGDLRPEHCEGLEAAQHRPAATTGRAGSRSQRQSWSPRASGSTYGRTIAPGRPARGPAAPRPARW